MKTCSKCKKSKPSTAFGVRTKAVDGLQSHCKECRSAYQKIWYGNASDLQKARVKASSKRNLNAARELIRRHLLTHPCVDCGETDILVLEFDHIDPSLKKSGISAMFGHGWIVLTELQEEIDKCEVRCANDHRRRTAQQFGWWKLMVEKANG